MEGPEATRRAVEACVKALGGAVDEVEGASHDAKRRADSVNVFLSMRGELALPTTHTCRHSQTARSLQALALAVDARVGPPLHRCGVTQWEMRVGIRGGGAWRMVVSNPTGVLGLVEVCYMLTC